MPALQQTFARPNHGGVVNPAIAQDAAGGRWDAILADRQVSSFGGNTQSYQRGGGGGGGFSGNYSQRYNRDNSGYGGQRENSYGRRDQEAHRPYHSHVGAQSGDTTGADWNTSLPANANLER